MRVIKQLSYNICVLLFCIYNLAQFCLLNDLHSSRLVSTAAMVQHTGH